MDKQENKRTALKTKPDMVYQNVLFLVVHYLNSSYLICFHFSKRVLFLSKNIQKSPVKKRRIFEINNFQIELRSRIERERRLGKLLVLFYQQ